MSRVVPQFNYFCMCILQLNLEECYTFSLRNSLQTFVCNLCLFVHFNRL